MFIKRLFDVTLPRSAFGDTDLVRVRGGLPKESAFTIISKRLSMRATTVSTTTFASNRLIVRMRCDKDVSFLWTRVCKFQSSFLVTERHDGPNQNGTQDLSHLDEVSCFSKSFCIFTLHMRHIGTLARRKDISEQLLRAQQLLWTARRMCNYSHFPP
jgi:hypothetical protein